MLAIGPLSNLRAAIELDPEFASNVKEVVVMGGAFMVSGNVNPACEANFFNDPTAADGERPATTRRQLCWNFSEGLLRGTVLCTSGCKLKLLGLDVTQQSWITVADMKEKIATSGSGGAWMNEVMQFCENTSTLHHKLKLLECCTGDIPGGLGVFICCCMRET